MNESVYTVEQWNDHVNATLDLRDVTETADRKSLIIPRARLKQLIEATYMAGYNKALSQWAASPEHDKP